MPPEIRQDLEDLHNTHSEIGDFCEDSQEEDYMDGYNQFVSLMLSHISRSLTVDRMSAPSMQQTTSGR